MTYAIEPVYIAIPLLCLLCAYTRIRNTRLMLLFLVLVFVVFYAFSLNGADIVGYWRVYTIIERGVSYSDVTQEYGYYLLNKAAAWLELDYLSFRVLLLTTLIAVFAVAARKFSPNLPMTLFFFSSMFTIYIISTYRQFLVMAFSLVWFHVYTKGKRRAAIAGILSLFLFHSTAILPLLCLLCCEILGDRGLRRTAGFLAANSLLLLAATMAIRLAALFVFRIGFVARIVESVLTNHASSAPSLISFGLASRAFFFVVLSYLYHSAKPDDRKTVLLYWYCSVSLLLYICIPLEFFMGRLVNNAYFLSALLIPMLRRDVYSSRTLNAGNAVRDIKLAVLLLQMAALLILLNQLRQQVGYTPYMNILLGNKIKFSFDL